MSGIKEIVRGLYSESTANQLTGLMYAYYLADHGCSNDNVLNQLRSRGLHNAAAMIAEKLTISLHEVRSIAEKMYWEAKNDTVEEAVGCYLLALCDSEEFQPSQIFAMVEEYKQVAKNHKDTLSFQAYCKFLEKTQE